MTDPRSITGTTPAFAHRQTWLIAEADLRRAPRRSPPDDDDHRATDDHRELGGVDHLSRMLTPMSCWIFERTPDQMPAPRPSPCPEPL